MRKIGWTRQEKVRWTVAIAAYVLVSALALIFAPDWLVSKTTGGDDGPGAPLTNSELITAVAAARQSILLAAGGGLALVTLVVTISRDAIARARADRESDEQLVGQFTEAINQLGHVESLSIRLGGIYGLERLADVADEYHFPARAVLAQFIRERTRDSHDTEPPGDAESAASALARLTRASNRGPRLSLAGANLGGAPMQYADLEGWACNEIGAERVDLSYAWLEASDFRSARLSLAKLAGAELSKTVLEDASLEQANLGSANLSNANARRANFAGANLDFAILKGAILRSANLTGASMHGAEIYGASLQGATVNGVDLRAVKGWSEDQLRTIDFYDQHTRWPDGYLP